MLRLYDIYHPAFNSRPFKCKSEKNMPFRPQRLNSVLIQKLDAFLKANSFPDLYRAYGLVAQIWVLCSTVPHICPILADVGLLDSPGANL